MAGNRWSSYAMEAGRPHSNGSPAVRGSNPLSSAEEAKGNFLVKLLNNRRALWRVRLQQNAHRTTASSELLPHPARRSLRRRVVSSGAWPATSNDGSEEEKFFEKSSMARKITACKERITPFKGQNYLALLAEKKVMQKSTSRNKIKVKLSKK